MLGQLQSQQNKEPGLGKGGVGPDESREFDAVCRCLAARKVAHCTEKVCKGGRILRYGRARSALLDIHGDFFSMAMLLIDWSSTGNYKILRKLNLR